MCSSLYEQLPINRRHVDSNQVRDVLGLSELLVVNFVAFLILTQQSLLATHSPNILLLRFDHAADLRQCRGIFFFDKHLFS